MWFSVSRVRVRVKIGTEVARTRRESTVTGRGREGPRPRGRSGSCARVGVMSGTQRGDAPHSREGASCFGRRAALRSGEGGKHAAEQALAAPQDRPAASGSRRLCRGDCSMLMRGVKRLRFGARQRCKSSLRGAGRILGRQSHSLAFAQVGLMPGFRLQTAPIALPHRGRPGGVRKSDRGSGSPRTGIACALRRRRWFPKPQALTEPVLPRGQARSPGDLHGETGSGAAAQGAGDGRLGPGCSDRSQKEALLSGRVRHGGGGASKAANAPGMRCRLSVRTRFGTDRRIGRRGLTRPNERTRC
jgi:hypothetical protein